MPDHVGMLWDVVGVPGEPFYKKNGYMKHFVPLRRAPHHLLTYLVAGKLP